MTNQGNVVLSLSGNPGHMVVANPDPFVQAPGFSQSYNRYTYCLNNPLVFTDPDGEFWWFVAIGTVIGGTTGGILAHNNGGKWWQGAIAGAFVGAWGGGMLAAAVGAPGIAANGVLTQSWGITSNMLNGASMNIAANAFSGGGWDGAWKAGIVGALSSGWSATNGLKMLPKGTGGTFGGNLARRLSYQMIGTSTQSIGNNWAMGRKPFSKVTLGVGPVNFTLGNGRNWLRWENNLGNIAFNGLGLVNLATGGKMSFNKEHLAFNYYGGLVGKAFQTATGAYATWYRDNLRTTDMETYLHELGHIWQSRGENDFFLLNYFSSSLFPLLHPELTGTDNYYEDLAEFFKKSIWGR